MNSVCIGDARWPRNVFCTGKYSKSIHHVAA